MKSFQKEPMTLQHLPQRLKPQMPKRWWCAVILMNLLIWWSLLKRSNGGRIITLQRSDPTMTAFYQKLGKDAEAVFSTSQWEPGVVYQTDDNKMFLEPFIEKYNVIPSYHAATAFAAGQILATAIKKTNSLDRKKIRDVLSTMDAMNIIGRYGVDKNGMQIKHFPITIQWQNGKTTIVWPEDVAKAAPIIK